MAQRQLTFDAPLTPADLPRIGKQFAASESGISARLRDCRKSPVHWTIERRLVAGTKGVFEYRKS